MPLGAKITRTKHLIREWYEAHDGLVYLARSGGKDSDVVADILLDMYKDVPHVFADTGNELESVRQHIMDEIARGHPIEIVYPEMSFEEIVEKHGYPVISKKVSRQISDLKLPDGVRESSKKLYWDGIKSDGTITKSFKLSEKWRYLKDAPLNVTNKCCGILKINPTKPYEKETGRKPIVGTMADESKTRLNSYFRGGCNAFNMSSPASRPIMFWTEQDVLQYIKGKNLSIAGAYGDIVKSDDVLVCTGDKRTGCKFCLFGVHLEKGENRIQRLARIEPESYRHCIEDLGYDRVMDIIGVDWKPYRKDIQMDMIDSNYEEPV